MSEGPDKGKVDEGAHFINVLMLDRHGNRIDRRNPQDIFTPLYDHQIPPGAANVLHYRIQLPADLKEAVELFARVRYRKFDFAYMEIIHGRGKVPQLPIVDLCSDKVLLPLAGGKTEASKIPGWQRLNDYGIGCFLEGGPDGKGPGEKGQAKAAFQRLLSPEFKNVKVAHAHGNVNLARVHLAYGGQRTRLAAEVLTQARKCDPPAPWWTVAWFTGLVNLEDGNLDDAIKNFEQILDPKNRDPVRKLDFTKDYVVRKELGKTLYLRAREEEGAEATQFLRRAIAHFERVLEQDAEDVVAHEYLNQCYGRLAKGHGPSELPKSLTEEEREFDKLVSLIAARGGVNPRRGAAEINPAARMEAARKLAQLLKMSKTTVRMTVLLHIRQRLLKVPDADIGLRLLIAQSLTELDRHLLAGVPDLGKRLADPALEKDQRIQAADELTAVLSQLAVKPAPGNARPLIGFASIWPVPGLPANMALEALAVGGYLQGPLPPPRLLHLGRLRQQVRPLFDGDGDLREAAAMVLARIHLVMHAIYKPDENAQGEAQRIYRQRHPLADRASHNIIIYDLTN